uniref:Uncharacterized protein n=1 Tax=Plectus sambesii TaxID=2011161 RepID=A0A914WDH1_9BILA
MRVGDAKLACCLLLLIIPVAVCLDHRVCKKFQACGAVQYDYSMRTSTSTTTTTTTTTTTAEPPAAEIMGSGEGGLGSGEGSGEGSAETDDGTLEPPLLYDEFVPTVEDEHDTSADPTTSASYELCSCENNETCPLKDMDESRLMHLDSYIALAFCRPVAEEFLMQCTGGRSIIRVIGRVDADETGRTHMVGFEDSLVFCSCSNGRYHRDPIVEPWKKGVLHAFKYSCG